jgi:hypothetical protein
MSNPPYQIDTAPAGDETPVSAADTATVEPTVLKEADRCDGPDCGAQARSIVTLASGNRLLFCRHHTEVYATTLTAQGAAIDRQYAGLENRPDASA